MNQNERKNAVAFDLIQITNTGFSRVIQLAGNVVYTLTIRYIYSFLVVFCFIFFLFQELINCVDRVLNQVEHIGVNPFSSLIRDRTHRNSKLIPSSFSDNEIIVDRPRNARRYFYVTLLRDPIARFVSEFKHVQRGATWKSSRHWCGSRLPTPKELPRCYTGSNWANVSLSGFMSCPHNLAFNRQTRMLADLSLVSCYNQSVMSTDERNLVMLNSAKRNLRQMAFFGLCEEQIASQYLFERTFNQKFKRAFVQFNSTRSRATLQALSSDEIKLIHKLNHLDIKLYAFARELFRERFTAVKSVDVDFEKNFEFLLQKSQHQPKRVSTTTPKSKRANGLEPSTKEQPSVMPEEEEDDAADDQSNDIIYDDGTHAHDSVEDYYSNRLDEANH